MTKTALSLTAPRLAPARLARPILMAALLSTALALSPVAMTPALAGPVPESFADLVVQECGSCHGLTLRGGLGRPLTREGLEDRPLDLVRDIILDGLPGTPMPPWRPLLSEKEAAAIAEMLKNGVLP